MKIIYIQLLGGLLIDNFILKFTEKGKGPRTAKQFRIRMEWEESF